MAIKPMPTHIREYYKAMREAYTQMKEEAIKEYNELSVESDTLQNDILERHEDYLKYNINLSEFPEFINNRYEDGHFLRVAHGAYINKENDYEIVSDLFNLLKLAKNQKRIKELESNIDFYNKILSIKTNEYIRYIRTFFNEVHKKMIIEGVAYHIGHGIGDVAINRCKVRTKRKALDFKATKLKKQEILESGHRLYDKESEEYAKAHGLDYNAPDHRVFMEGEFYYEIFLTNQKYTDARSFEFTPQDYRSVDVRGKTNEDLARECDNNLAKICELPVDLKTKIAICTSVDKMLYTNFIRNENQTSYKHSEASWKD